MGKSTRPGSTLALDRNGDLIGAGKFLYMMDEHREINCDMDFAQYPMDTQVCYFRIQSGMYAQDKLVRFQLLSNCEINTWGKDFEETPTLTL